MEGRVDCLLEVSACFFKAGDKTTTNLEDIYTFTSYGPWLDAKGQEYWDLRPPKDPETTDDGMLRCYDIESEEHYAILKDFIGFSFKVVFFGDFGDHRGSGIYFDELGLEEHFEGSYEDDLVAYAKEEKAKWDADRKRHNEEPCRNRMAEETTDVKFILALDYVSECVSYWESEECETRVEIVGKLDMARIREIII